MFNTVVRRLRWFLFFACIIWAGYASHTAKHIGPLTENEEFFPESHPLRITRNIIRTEFTQTNMLSQKVNIYWSVKSINKESASSWNPNFIGEVIFDDDFDLSPVQAQLSLIDLCSSLKTKSFVVNQEVDCWIQKFYQWN